MGDRLSDVMRELGVFAAPEGGLHAEREAEGQMRLDDAPTDMPRVPLRSVPRFDAERAPAASGGPEEAAAPPVDAQVTRDLGTAGLLPEPEAVPSGGEPPRRYPLHVLQEAHHELRRLHVELEERALKVAARVIGRRPPHIERSLLPQGGAEFNEAIMFCLGAMLEEISISKRLLDLMTEAEIATRSKRAA